MNAERRSRKTLVLIGLCFAAPMLVSLILTRAGWMPSGRKNYGELLSPPMPLINAPLIDGTTFTWKTPEWYWTLLVRVPNDCVAACREHLDLLPNLRDALARDATKLRIALADSMPEGALLIKEHGVYRLAEPVDINVDNAMPKPSNYPQLALVDPNGYVIMRYPEQADLSKVRKDLAKLLK
jgi:hypothetical protein